MAAVTAPPALNLLDLYSDLQESIAINLNLEELQNYCRVNTLFSSTCRDKVFMKRWFKPHNPDAINDYIKIADANPELGGFQIVHIVKIFSFGADRLSREAGRQANLTLFRYYMATYGYTYSAFENFYLGLIESNKELAPSSEALEILNYILLYNNIREFVVDPNKFDQTITNIKFYMDLHNYCITARSLPPGVSLPRLPSFPKRVHEMIVNSKLLKEGQSNVEVIIKYCVKCGLIITPYEYEYYRNLLVDNLSFSKFYKINLAGILELGRYEEGLNKYIPYTQGAITNRDFYDVIISAFKEYSIIYYSRENLNNYLNFIISYVAHYDDLFEIEDTGILRKLFITGMSTLITDNLSSVTLISEFPGKVIFNFSDYLTEYSNRMMQSINLGLIPNNLIKNVLSKLI